MTYDVTVSEDKITLDLALESVTVVSGGVSYPLKKLSMPLSFARKAANLSELGGGLPEWVYVFARVDLDPMGFDAFARNLCRDADWLEGMFFALPIADARACVMVVSPGRPVLFVDTQGSSYARYVARLG